MTDMMLNTKDHFRQSHLTLTTASNAKNGNMDIHSSAGQLSHDGRVICGDPICSGLSRSAISDQNGQGSRSVTVSTADMDISGGVWRSFAPADGLTRNGMIYSVYDASRRQIPGIFLNFRTSGNAILSAASGRTDQFGKYLLTLSNKTIEKNFVTAEIIGNPGLNNNTILEFLPVGEIPYEILYEVIKDNAPADGVSENQILFTLLRPHQGIMVPVTNARMWYSFAPSSTTYHFPNNFDLTDTQGQLLMLLSTRVPGTTIVEAAFTHPDPQPGVPDGFVRASVTFGSA
ncbi:Ig-like domain-containing protein [Martelella alba]|uniref:Big-1 domain-containing protein n=1 Tax=Martelella alba TaxID=2590451 RepID=A0ABY2SHQ3_9HYPH|nr:Ig-like domain-containing protein [Martelella alba]TKI04160.1 hypothetical protein FCN80_18955 [Martelella alba]